MVEPFRVDLTELDEDSLAGIQQRMAAAHFEISWYADDNHLEGRMPMPSWAMRFRSVSCAGTGRRDG
ncbi:hypothetical protein [Nocardia arizonensis]|uniref:hypothetical protein n=1 Tax=Nocardia arizonensis TaxID=1141647 RepID=UPI0006D0313B|nr:hypothetical protein [Nocardia arizonensis]